MKRCLVAVSRASLGESLAASLSESGFTVGRCASSEEALHCLDGEAPEAIVTDLHDHLGLRVLTLAESLRLRLPVLVLGEGAGWIRSLAFPLSPYLRLYRLDSSRDAWRSQIGEAVGSAARVETEVMFRWTDYVQLAVLSELSVALHGRRADNGDVLVEVVGGDVWNVWAGEAEGVDALVGILPSAPRDMDVSTLRSVPAGRQIRHSGWDLLEECAKKIPDSSREMTSGALGTRPISVEEMRDILESEGAGATSEGDGPESFEDLLERGFAAALARNYEGAVEAFEKALELRPEDTRVRFNLDKVRKRLEAR